MKTSQHRCWGRMKNYKIEYFKPNYMLNIITLRQLKLSLNPLEKKEKPYESKTQLDSAIILYLDNN